MSIPVSEGFPVILARRSIVHGQVVNQCLCLTNGRSRAYRLFTADGTLLHESVDDVAPIEFDDTADDSLTEFLIESFWLMVIDAAEIHYRISTEARRSGRPPPDHNGTGHVR